MPPRLRVSKISCDRLLALDLTVDVDELPPELRSEILAEARFAGTHEADEGDVTV